MSQPRFFMLAGIILGAALSRLVPHPWNVAPIAAMALFGGAQFGDKKLAFIVPLAALFLSDIVIGFYSSWPFVYGSFAFIVLLGMRLRNQPSVTTLVGASLLSSFLFFALTNLGVWLVDGLYPKNISGFFQCYTAALPFFRNSILGDLFYTSVLFGSARVIEKFFPLFQESQAQLVPQRSV